MRNENAHIDALKDSVYQSLWHYDSGMPDPLPPLQEDARCQLVVVGGGFTGLWGALQAKEREPDLDVILVEQTFIGDGASGRNGGFLEATLTHGETNADYHFPGEKQRLHELGEQNLREYLESLDRYGIDAQYEKTGVMTVALSEAMVEDLREQYEEEKAAGSDVVWYDTGAIREEVNSPTYLAGLWRRDGEDGVIHPGRLCWGLKRTLLDLGVRIFENTPVMNLAPDGKGIDGGMRVICPGGEIRSDRVLMATNAFRNTLSAIDKQVIPVWDYQIATEPLTEAQMDAIRWGHTRHAMSDEVNMFHYYRLTKDNRITWGGGGSVCYYYGARTDFGVADDTARFEDLAKGFLKTFPQLEGIKFTHHWSGIIATSTRFCMVPGTGFDGRVAWSVGYTGLGVGATRFGARIGLEMLGYQPSDILDMQFVQRKAMNWFPEPIRWLGVTLTRHELSRADRNGGRRGLWLKLLDHLNLGFAC